MGSLGSVGDAVRTVRERPARLAAGAVVGAFEVATWLLLWATVWLLQGTFEGVAVLLQRVLLFVGIGVLAPGCYAALRGSPDGVREALALVRDGVERDGRAVGLAALWAHAAGVAIAGLAWLLLSGVGLALDAVVQSLAAAVGPARWAAGPQSGGWVLGLAALLAATVVRPPLAFYDRAVLDGDAAPRRAWLASLRATTARPASLAAYGLVRWALLAAPVLVALLVAGAAGVLVNASGIGGTAGAASLVLAAAVAFVGASAVCRTVLAASHERVASERFGVGEVAGEASGTGATGRTPPGRGTLAAVLLVLATVAGAGVGLRIADVGPGAAPQTVEPVEDDAAPPTLQWAYRRTWTTSRTERVTTTTGGETGDGAVRGRQVLRFDPADRQAVARTTRPGTATDGTAYVEEGLSARRGRADSALGVFVDRDEESRRGEWHLRPASPDEAAVAREGFYPDPDADWSLRTRSEDRAVFELNGSDDLQWVHGPHAPDFPYDGDDVTYLDGNYVRVGVNRSTGRLDRIRARAHYREVDGEETRTVDVRVRTEFSNYGRTGVVRPAPLDPPPIESRLQDALGY